MGQLVRLHKALESAPVLSRAGWSGDSQQDAPRGQAEMVADLLVALLKYVPIGLISLALGWVFAQSPLIGSWLG